MSKVKLGKDLINARTAGETDRLIKAGADINFKTIKGFTALMLAKTAEQTQLLIEAAGDKAGEAAKSAYVNVRSGYNDSFDACKD